MDAGQRLGLLAGLLAAPEPAPAGRGRHRRPPRPGPSMQQRAWWAALALITLAVIAAWATLG